MIKVTMLKKGMTTKRGTPVQGFKPPRKSTSALWLSKQSTPRKWQESAYSMNPDIRGYFRASTSSQLTHSGPRNLEEQINIVIFDKLMKRRRDNHSAGSAENVLAPQNGIVRDTERPYTTATNPTANNIASSVTFQGQPEQDEIMRVKKSPVHDIPSK
jgi:hypothetical protein